MSEQYAVLLDPDQTEDDDDPRRITVEAYAPDELAIQILSADQSATEFLTREHFEDLVSNARRIMGWTAP